MERDKQIHEDLMWKLQAGDKELQKCRRGSDEAQLALVEWGSGGSSRKSSGSNDPNVKMAKIGQIRIGFSSAERSCWFACSALRSLWEDTLGKVEQSAGGQCSRWDRKELKPCGWIDPSPGRPQEELLVRLGRQHGAGQDWKEHDTWVESTLYWILPGKRAWVFLFYM